jgi:hypothetical protein
MKRLLVNIALFFVALLLLATVGVYGLIYSIIYSLINYSKVQFVTFCTDLLYSINVGIDQIGNVLLGTFLNQTCLIDKTRYPFGKVDKTISNVLAVNYFADNLTAFGLWIVNILESLDNNHMAKSL